MRPHLLGLFIKAYVIYLRIAKQTLIAKNLLSPDYQVWYISFRQIEIKVCVWSNIWS